MVYYLPLRTMLIIGSSHLISQTGWNRCNPGAPCRLAASGRKLKEACRPPLSQSESPGGGWGWDRGRRCCSYLPGLKLGIPFFFLAFMWTLYMSGSYHLISQAGWNSSTLLYSTLLYSTLLRWTCCEYPCLVRYGAPWCAFCGSRQVAMLCLVSLVLGMQCLALKGYALSVSLHFQMNGTPY